MIDSNSWVSIKAIDNDNTYIMPISPKLTVPTDYPAIVLTYLNRVYASTASAYTSENLQLELVLLLQMNYLLIYLFSILRNFFSKDIDSVNTKPDQTQPCSL
jgi:hypothetical protein